MNEKAGKQFGLLEAEQENLILIGVVALIIVFEAPNKNLRNLSLSSEVSSKCV